MISIPVALLWRVRISLRKKLALGSVLCLSVFAIIISIIKVAAADIVNGQVDSLWGFFWVQAEACVTVMAVSFTIFRSLFLSESSTAPKKPMCRPHKPQPPEMLLEPKKPYDYLPKVPDAIYSGITTSIRKGSPTMDKELSRSSTGDVILPIQGPRIKVTHDISLRNDVVST